MPVFTRPLSYVGTRSNTQINFIYQILASDGGQASGEQIDLIENFLRSIILAGIFDNSMEVAAQEINSRRERWKQFWGLNNGGP